MTITKWDEAYLDVAERFAMLSSATRLKVGCVIVKDNRIISIGYNGTPAGWDNECEYPVSEGSLTKPHVLHAEENCVGKLARSHESGEGATMYITHAPCVYCSKIIYASGISKVLYRELYRNDDGVKFLQQCGLEVRKC